jgi:hypothetical protein
MRLANPLTSTLLFTTTLLAACSDDTTNTDEVGDTDSTGTESESESESSESESESSESAESTDTDSTDTDATDTDATDTDATDTDSTDTDSTDTDSTDSDSTDSDSTDTGNEMCNADDVEDIDITLGLVGSQAPPGSCNDHVFTGTLQNGGGGNWNLDACPCGAQCLLPDPYTLGVVLPDPGMLPDVPLCPKIEMRRNADCEVVSITISDLGNDETPVWIGSREDVEPGTVDELDVNAELFGVCECPDCDPPTLYDLAFDWLGESLVLAEGEQDVLVADDGDWDVLSVSSHTREVGGTEHFAWVMKR